MTSNQSKATIEMEKLGGDEVNRDEVVVEVPQGPAPQDGADVRDQQHVSTKKARKASETEEIGFSGWLKKHKRFAEMLEKVREAHRGGRAVQS